MLTSRHDEVFRIWLPWLLIMLLQPWVKQRQQVSLVTVTFLFPTTLFLVIITRCYFYLCRDGQCNTDIRSRIGQAKIAFAKIPNLLVLNINLETRNKLLKTYVWSVALYGCEAWTIDKEERRLQAFEMWCYGKLLKINWEDKVTNEEILNLVLLL